MKFPATLTVRVESLSAQLQAYHVFSSSIQITNACLSHLALRQQRNCGGRGSRRVLRAQALRTQAAGQLWQHSPESRTITVQLSDCPMMADVPDSIVSAVLPPLTGPPEERGAQPWTMCGVPPSSEAIQCVANRPPIQPVAARQRLSDELSHQRAACAGSRRGSHAAPSCHRRAPLHPRHEA